MLVAFTPTRDTAVGYSSRVEHAGHNAESSLRTSELASSSTDRMS